MDKLRNVDGALIAVWLLLLALGIATLYSAGQTDIPSEATGAWFRQTIWIGLALIVATISFNVSPRLLEWATPGIYAAAIAILILTLFFGTGGLTAPGNKSWLAIGGIKIGQPAEGAKLAVILLLARHITSWREPPSSLLGLAPSIAIIGLPFLLIGAQPDLGSASILIGILFAMLFWGGVRPALLFILASPGLSLLLAFDSRVWGAWIIMLFAVLLWLRPYVWEGLTLMFINVVMGILAMPIWRNLAPYQQNRVLAFLNPELDPRAAGWHVIQSKVAIGSGGLLGHGFTEGPQKRLAFLPAQHTDFIFSVLGEELGFVGISLALGLFVAILLVLIRIARRTPDLFSSLLVFGVVGLLFTHIFQNVGMTVNLMPVTGIPLPFFSYGGSFMLTTAAAIGMCLRVAWETQHTRYMGASP